MPAHQLAVRQRLGLLDHARLGLLFRHGLGTGLTRLLLLLSPHGRSHLGPPRLPGLDALVALGTLDPVHDGARGHVDHPGVHREIRAGFQQGLNGLGPPLRRGEDQGRLPPRLLGVVHVGTRGHQRVHRPGTPRCGSEVKRRGTPGSDDARRRVGPRPEQHLHHLPGPGLAGQVERRVVPDTGPRTDLRPRFQQGPGQGGIAVAGGPVQGGHAVSLSLVDVGAIGEQRADRRRVPLHRRIGDGGIGPVPAR